MQPLRLFYTRKEASIILGLCIRTLDSLISNGSLHATRVGKKVLIPAASLEKLTNREFVPTSKMTAAV